MMSLSIWAVLLTGSAAGEMRWRSASGFDLLSRVTSREDVVGDQEPLEGWEVQIVVLFDQVLANELSDSISVGRHRSKASRVSEPLFSHGEHDTSIESNRLNRLVFRGRPEEYLHSFRSERRSLNGWPLSHSC